MESVEEAERERSKMIKRFQFLLEQMLDAGDEESANIMRKKIEDMKSQEIIYCDAGGSFDRICQECSKYSMETLLKFARALNITDVDENTPQRKVCSYIAKIASGLRLPDTENFIDISGKNVNFLIEPECFRFHTQDKKLELLACGMFGCAFKICNNDGVCNRILKVFFQHDIFQDNPAYDENEAVLREIEITRIAGELEAGPKVWDYWICKGRRYSPFTYSRRTGKLNDECKGRKNVIRDDVNKRWIYDRYVGFIEMEKFDMSLEQYRNNHKEDYEKNIQWIKKEMWFRVDKLHSNGITYRDYRGSNVVINVDDKLRPRKLRIIDYGLANFFIRDCLTIRNDGLDVDQVYTQ